MLHLFTSISFIIVLKFSLYKSFASLVKLIPKYFILFKAIIHGIIICIILYIVEISLLYIHGNFLIFFSDCSLLVVQECY